MTRTMKDSGVPWIGEIPSSWNILKNKVCFECSKTIIGEKSAVTQLLSLTTKGIKKKSAEDSTGKVPDSYDTYQVVNPGDIVMCLFDLDVSAVFSGMSPYSGMISPAYKILKCKENLLPKYADYWFSFIFDGRKFRHYAKNLRFTLNYDEFAVLPIAIPVLPEQEKIVSFLDAECARIDDVIEKTRASIEEYKKLKQAVITRAVTKGIRPDRPMKDSGIEWIGEIPEDWKKDKICRLFFTIGSGTTPKSNNDSNFEGSIHWIQSGDINGSYLTRSIISVSNEVVNKYSALKVYKAPFIIIAMYGASIGNTSISKIDGCVNQACCVLCQSNQVLQYFFYALQIAKEYLMWKAVGGGQPNISQDIVKQLWLPLPSKIEQHRIAAYLDAECARIDALIAQKEQFIVEMESFKKSLIFEYVTGKKEVV